MAIVNNQLTAIGDTVIFHPDQPLCNVKKISSYTESVVGETVTRVFDREFQYTLDGIHWSSWIALTNTNLNAVPVDPQLDFDIKYRYTRRGSDATGVLEWNWTQIQIVQPATPPTAVEFKKSVFSYFGDCCCNNDTLKWCLNVLEKLYRPGIVMKDMERGESMEDDRDYIDFWRSVTCYFALFVSYARQWEKFDQNRGLLGKYLENKSIFLRNTHTLSELTFIKKTYYKQIRERGTINIAASQEVTGTDIDRVDGEFLRVINCNLDQDEFLINVSSFLSTGWVLNQSSPIYREINFQPELNKKYVIRDGQAVTDTYPLLQPSACTITTLGGETVLQVDAVSGQESGIGFDSSSIPTNHLSIISPEITYSLSFYARVTDITLPITVKIHGFDLLQTNKNPDTIDISTNGNIALNTITLPQPNIYYLIKVILFPYTEPYVNDPQILTTSLNTGDNLKSQILTQQIIPTVIIDNPSSSVGSLYIKNFEFKPLSAPYSKGGLVNGQWLMEAWIKNNSLKYSDEQVKNIINQYLIPYKMGLIVNFIKR